MTQGNQHITTNIRLPLTLWKSLKIKAAHEQKRLSEVIRESLTASLEKDEASTIQGQSSLRGIWRDIEIPDSLVGEAKKALFTKVDKES